MLLQDKLPNGAVVAESVVALVTRKGNPKNIRGWDDLIRHRPPSLVPSLGCLAVWADLASQFLKRKLPLQCGHATHVQPLQRSVVALSTDVLL